MTTIQTGTPCWVGPTKINTFTFQQIGDVVAGSVAGGTFTVTVNGQTTPELAWNISAANLKTALEALSNVGTGGVVSVAGTDVNGLYIVTFEGTTAEGLMTANSASLTGPDAPYNVQSVGYTGTYPIASLADGDVLEDVFWAAVTTFDPSGKLSLYDNPEGSAAGDTWNTATSPFVEWNLAENGVYARFYGTNKNGGSPETTMSISAMQYGLTAVAAGDPIVQRVPVVASEAVTIYAYIDDISLTPVSGEVWIWVKVTTPVAP